MDNPTFSSNIHIYVYLSLSVSINKIVMKPTSQQLLSFWIGHFKYSTIEMSVRKQRSQ